MIFVLWCLVVLVIQLSVESHSLRFSPLHLFLSAEVKPNDTWRVGAGENSKEIGVQENRNRREKQTIYQTVREIPSNPKEPWDLEMDYDDTLTPAIPIEQLPDGDGDGAETQATPSEVVEVATASSSNTNTNIAEPDLELLAVLLKNPELVFALTSGQSGSIPSEETVKLLDMIKKGSVHLPDNVNGSTSGKAQEKVEVSLPSPTPPSESRTVRDLRLHTVTICRRSCQCLLVQFHAHSVSALSACTY